LFVNNRQLLVETLDDNHYRTRALVRETSDVRFSYPFCLKQSHYDDLLNNGKFAQSDVCDRLFGVALNEANLGKAIARFANLVDPFNSFGMKLSISHIFLNNLETLAL